MPKKVLLFCGSTSGLPGEEHDTLFRLFGGDLRLLNSRPQSAAEHELNCTNCCVDAVYIPIGIARLELNLNHVPMFKTSLARVPHYAQVLLDGAVAVLAQLRLNESDLIEYEYLTR